MPLVAPLAAPSTGLPEYIRTASEREISSADGTLRPQTPALRGVKTPRRDRGVPSASYSLFSGVSAV